MRGVLTRKKQLYSNSAQSKLMKPGLLPKGNQQGRVRSISSTFDFAIHKSPYR